MLATSSEAAQDRSDIERLSAGESVDCSPDTPISRLPTVDILMSTFNEGSYVRRCLECVLAQDYPAHLLTVWLIDGGSTDQTVSVVRELAEKDNRIRIIATGDRLNLPAALNIGIERSSAELVAKIDAHGYPDSNFIRLAVCDLARDRTLACVGGRPVQEGETRFGEAVAFARRSRVGVGGSEYASNAVQEYVTTVQCGVYRRAALDDVGWFDPLMNFGEDDELNWRLIDRGYRILLDPRVRFHYITRPTWRLAFRQYRNYGRARVGVVRKHPRYFRFYHAIPAAFLLTLGTLTLCGVFFRHARYALAFFSAVYLVALAAAAVWVAKRRLVLALRVVAAFTSLHFGYGIGMIGGAGRVLLDGLVHRFRSALPRRSSSGGSR